MKGRWTKNPQEEVYTTAMKIHLRGLSVMYLNSTSLAAAGSGKDSSWTIIPGEVCGLQTNINISMDKLNFTEVLYTRYFLTPDIDFTNLDFSTHFHVKCSPIKLHFHQEVLTYMHRCNDLNIGYVDGQMKHF